MRLRTPKQYSDYFPIWLRRVSVQYQTMMAIDIIHRCLRSRQYCQVALCLGASWNHHVYNLTPPQRIQRPRLEWQLKFWSRLRCHWNGRSRKKSRLIGGARSLRVPRSRWPLWKTNHCPWPWMIPGVLDDLVSFSLVPPVTLSDLWSAFTFGA